MYIRTKENTFMCTHNLFSHKYYLTAIGYSESKVNIAHSCIFYNDIFGY